MHTSSWITLSSLLSCYLLSHNFYCVAICYLQNMSLQSKRCLQVQGPLRLGEQETETIHSTTSQVKKVSTSNFLTKLSSLNYSEEYRVGLTRKTGGGSSGKSKKTHASWSLPMPVLGCCPRLPYHFYHQILGPMGYDFVMCLTLAGYIGLWCNNWEHNVITHYLITELPTVMKIGQWDEAWLAWTGSGQLRNAEGLAKKERQQGSIPAELHLEPGSFQQCTVASFQDHQMETDGLNALPSKAWQCEDTRGTKVSN